MQSIKIRGFIAAGALLAAPALLVACGSDSSPDKAKPTTTTEVMKEKDTTTTIEAMTEEGKKTNGTMMEGDKPSGSKDTTSTTEAMTDPGK